MGNVKVVVDEGAIRELLIKNPAVAGVIMSTAEGVKSAAEATAQDAQGGPEGRLRDYAEAGFSTRWVASGRRPQVWVLSNADGETALRVHLSTTKRWGIGHLRRALREGS